MATVLTSYYRPKPGGYCKRQFRAIQALLDGGHEVRYVSVARFPIDHRNCHYHRFLWPEHKTDNFLFWFCFHLAAPIVFLYVGFKHGVTHCFAFNPTYTFLMQPLRLIKRTPVTLFLRADNLENHKISGRTQALIGLESLLEALAVGGTAIYGVTQTLTRDVVSRHPLMKPTRIGTLYNDLEPPTAPRDRTRGESIVFGCAGILEKRKNQIVPVRCMNSMRNRSVRLILFGEGPEKTALIDEVSALDIGHMVEFAGWVCKDLIWPQIDVLLLPSLHEGLSNALLEALALDVPVLVSDIPEHREILHEVSLLPPGKVESWEKEMCKIVSDPEGRLSEIQAQLNGCKNRLVFDWDAEIVTRIVG